MATTRLYTFIDLFTTNDEENKLPLQKIEIPIIQRDYAQGRQTDDVNRIRERFLTSLYDALTLDKQIKLDFVYGDINENGVLIPLDGQQRLTTLFLLHWYIARHESVSEEIGAFVGKFSYETRYSARTFCDKLMEFSPDFSQDNLSEEIKDQSWMPLDWKHDPTINSKRVPAVAIKNPKTKERKYLFFIFFFNCLIVQFIKKKERKNPKFTAKSPRIKV